MERQIHEQYPLVLGKVNSGSSLNKAVQTSGMSRSSFFKLRYMAEMQLVDPPHYHHLRDQFLKSTEKLSAECKEPLTDKYSAFTRRANEMRQTKELLPLS